MYYLIYDDNDFEEPFEIVEIKNEELTSYNWFKTPKDMFNNEEVHKEYKTIEHWLKIWPNRWHLLATFTDKPSANTVHEFINTNYPELLI